MIADDPFRVIRVLGGTYVSCHDSCLRRLEGREGIVPHVDLKDHQEVDIAAVFDRHLEGEFELRDIEVVMGTMCADPYLLHVPTMTGGVGYEAVRSFYETYFIGRWPADTKSVRLSHTVGEDRLVDELLISFTHDVEMEALLPGVRPTGKYVELPHVVVAQFENGKVCHEHVYWDQASLLTQIGLIDRRSLPITGIEQARKLQDKSLPSNTLLERLKDRS